MSNFINYDYKLVIIHVPKCGGSSIRKYSNLKFTDRFMGYLPEKVLSFYKVGFCRHPISRFKSAFKMFKYGTNTISPILKDLTINDAINYLQDDSIEHHDLSSPIENFKHHAIPITHQYNCIQHADVIVKFENYSSDVKKFLTNKGVPVKINKTNYTPKLDINLTGDQERALYKYYKTDFEEFNYNYI